MCYESGTSWSQRFDHGRRERGDTTWTYFFALHIATMIAGLRSHPLTRRVGMLWRACQWVRFMMRGCSDRDRADHEPSRPWCISLSSRSCELRLRIWASTCRTGAPIDSSEVGAGISKARDNQNYAELVVWFAAGTKHVIYVGATDEINQLIN